MYRLLVLCLLTSVAVAACADPPANTTPKTVTGVVVDVTSRGLGKVSGFVVKDGGRTYEIKVDREIEYSFPLDHLNEHRATADPVRVELEKRGKALMALSIEDA